MLMIHTSVSVILMLPAARCDENGGFRRVIARSGFPPPLLRRLLRREGRHAIARGFRSTSPPRNDKQPSTRTSLTTDS